MEERMVVAKRSLLAAALKLLRFVKPCIVPDCGMEEARSRMEANVERFARGLLDSGFPLK